MHDSNKSIGCIHLSSFELKAILLIPTVKELSFSFFILCCVFNISLLFTNFLRLPELNF